MKIAITGGTGFLGRTVARLLAKEGHELVLFARGVDQSEPAVRTLPNARFLASALDNSSGLARALTGCSAVVHCAGINREIGSQTYQSVHIDGTRHVVEAAKQARVMKIVLISFLRARPNCGSGYHESKWAAEEIVRHSGLDYTILKCGVIYGPGDHMLNHLSHAFHTFPIFAFVGFRDKPMRPNAVEDVARIVRASVLDGELSRKTVPIMGPEELTLREAVRRVARVTERKPLMFPMPVTFHYLLGWCLEKVMRVPMVSVAQVRILAEGLAEAAAPYDPMPSELAPRLPFSEEQIRKGLPVRCLSLGKIAGAGDGAVWFPTQSPLNAFFSKCPEPMNKSFPSQTVEWRDLVELSPAEKVWELALSLPWLVLSCCCYGHGWVWPGLACSFYFFLTGLRQSHNAQHYALDLPRKAQDAALFALSVLMLASMHAVQVNHLHHHRHCLEDEDYEGATAHLSWWRAILAGPRFYIRLHLWAWRLASRRKRVWIATELVAITCLLILAFDASHWRALRWHVGAMLAGECLTGFFAVWTVHHGCGAREPGRTQRGKWLNRLSYSMFFHAEHHLFPAVPTGHLHLLARRLDTVMPEVRQQQVFGFTHQKIESTRAQGL